jgi:DNA recombination protein RmuC
MEYITPIGIGIVIILLILLLVKKPNNDGLKNDLREMENDLKNDNQRSLSTFSNVLSNSNKETNMVLDKRLTELTSLLKTNQEQLQNTVYTILNQMNQTLTNTGLSNEQKLNQIRETVEKRLTSLQEENSKKLDEMRMTVDEKLQKTLEDRISQSFKQVSEQLESVYKGLGEMRKIGVEVGDLTKILSNVKTRGMLGEIQLGSILEQILSPEQYVENYVTIPGTKNPVEFAVKLPGDESGPVYLPIDSKFPTEDYVRLISASEVGDKALIDASWKALESKIKSFAKDIKEKYVRIPYTTEFAILFLPTEGLYAEVVQRGLIEILQRDYQINIAGPTTMAALLNSLQMGFKTLAIQKRSGEVWSTLSSVKAEFEKFGSVLQNAQDKLTKTSEELDKLVGVRTRMIQSKLKNVSTLEIKQESLIEEDISDE